MIVTLLPLGLPPVLSDCSLYAIHRAEQDVQTGRLVIQTDSTLKLRCAVRRMRERRWLAAP